MELKDLALILHIPSNFRAVKVNRYVVEILHPRQYELTKCGLPPEFVETFAILPESLLPDFLRMGGEMVSLGPIQTTHLEGAGFALGVNQNFADEAFFIARHPTRPGFFVVYMLSCDCVFPTALLVNNIQFFDPIPLR
ncbi:MAG: hypothetical protein NZL92_11540 [Gloeomargarita sp. SKYG116]|nr:hypothetical protein [Gloeomargarita sp. SKYG116]MCS7293755.1 hypothetical protein [Gloeomargarita sp. SKYB120]MDW8179321.1 hypothetical protein [Gloeomargarita sp. SKYBB_i_bin120]MDW8402315.1 hypothetical protein [Gloeomargarita sp. SKYGB_i_bin116]